MHLGSPQLGPINSTANLERQNAVAVSAILAGRRDSICAPVAPLAMPFTPVPTPHTNLAMPGARILNHITPAE